jgi:Skp family chaperone for outer membrane proteins
MRQGFIAAAFCAAALFTLSPAQAASSTGPKIGVVDPNAVVDNSHRGVMFKTAMTQKIDELKQQAADKSNKAKDLKDKLDKTNAKAANYQTLLKQYNDANDDLNSFLNESNQLVNKRRQEFLQSVQDELTRVVTQFAKDNQYDIILVKGAGAAFTSDAYDITSQVTTALDKDWDALQQKPATAPAASTAAGPSH